MTPAKGSESWELRSDIHLKRSLSIKSPNCIRSVQTRDRNEEETMGPSVCLIHLLRTHELSVHDRDNIGYFNVSDPSLTKISLSSYSEKKFLQFHGLP
jgi:hypothetical protein